MSLPDEQALALVQARQFLVSLCIPQETPKVPRSIRIQASHRLKHFPMSWDWDRIVDDQLAMEQATKAEEYYLKKVWGNQ
jgi:hypothetical protein